MIRVSPAPEPPDFDRTVRQPGRAIAELSGKRPAIARTTRPGLQEEWAPQQRGPMVMRIQIGTVTRSTMSGLYLVTLPARAHRPRRLRGQAS